MMTSLCRLVPNFLFFRLCCECFPAADFSSKLRSLSFLGRTHLMRTLGRQETHTTEYRPCLLAWQPNGRHSVLSFTFSSQHPLKKGRYQTKSNRSYLTKERNLFNLVPSRLITPVISTGISPIIANFAISKRALRENFSHSEKFSFQITGSCLMTDFFPQLDISFSSTFIKEILSDVTRRRINFSTLNFQLV